MEFQKILDAQKRLEGTIKKTELIYSDFFSKESGNQIYIKPENLQLTGAFKLRGAYNKISALKDELSPEELQKGLISSSAGNHAQGVALAAQKLGIRATIVMPKATPLIKVDSTKSYGADVVLYGECYDEAYEEALRRSREEGYIFIHPFNDEDVMAGQGTIGLEILDELHDADCIIVPIGGGGLIGGIALAAKTIKPDIKIIGVEPYGAACMKLSMDNGVLTCLENVRTIADGVAVKNPGDLSFSIIKDYVDEIITVSDYEIMEYFLMLLEKHKLVAENAGVLSLAALKKISVRDQKIVCVVSGGNIDVVTISTMINRGLVSRGRLFCFAVELPDKPGELLKISKIIAETNANVVKLDHNQFKVYDRFMQVQLEVTLETNGFEHIEAITKALSKEGFVVEQIY